MIGALLLGLVAGFIGRALMPGDSPRGFFATIIIGLVGAALGWVIFTLGVGIGDDDMFDLGGLAGAVIGVLILLFAYQRLVEARAPAGPALSDAEAADARTQRRRVRASERERS